MPDYSDMIAAIVQDINLREAALPLKNEACRSRFLLHPQPTSKVCLFFHGFTAAPYQFEPLGQALFDAGYNVITPLQPGHGQAGDWGRNNPPPLPEEIEVYQQFALDWLHQAQALGERVVVGGLSSGATLAAWLALEKPQQIDRTLLFAPYISGGNRVMNWFVQILPYYFEWMNKELPGNFGYDGFRIPALRIFLELGRTVVDRIKQAPIAPLFVLSSEDDHATNANEHRELFESALHHQPQSWYHSFDESLNIPHTMMTKSEGNQYQDLLITLAKAFIESDLTWAELRAIGQQMLNGKPFEKAVADLNLGDRVVPELSVMMSVLDPSLIIAPPAS
ncbi:alpha/beta fold hydrolase [Oculatella sp. LEGE 06141]|uniref:alpha/beta hydrolase n=1 Tax=Oculatella sp. LEGE 06141 TaxID=1828648 RepID=UPI00188154CF|nr:alpha/beta fold hydrolase [Oculatella sp. LEGE 06141]MBE9180887.1 alpha/beta fold hydrolase [Oculatella sp. LEGE 06141]